MDSYRQGYIKALIDVKNYVDEMIAMGDMIELTLTFDHKSIQKSKERYHD